MCASGWAVNPTASSDGWCGWKPQAASSCSSRRDDLDADLVSLIYRHRWQIELFFKWIKCILGCRHWLAESPAGLTIQIYSALIASVLLVLWTGRKPTKRQWEALQLFWMGWASLEELTEILTPKKKSA